jgi:hypothetical protein
MFSWRVWLRVAQGISAFPKSQLHGNQHRVGMGQVQVLTWKRKKESRQRHVRYRKESAFSVGNSNMLAGTTEDETATTTLLCVLDHQMFSPPRKALTTVSLFKYGTLFPPPLPSQHEQNIYLYPFQIFHPVSFPTRMKCTALYTVHACLYIIM